jgi:thiol-disulfide isomerase/thioredoxin
MRKIILGAVVIGFVLLATFLITGVINKMQRQTQIKEKIETMPSFSFMTLTNETFNSSEIKIGPVLIVRFHPECEHCQYEVSEILKSNVPESGVKVILISSATPDSVKSFLNQFNYLRFPSIILLIDTSYVFSDIFGSDIVPSNYIYNRELELVKVLQGETKTETILKYLKVSE